MSDRDTFRAEQQAGSTRDPAAFASCAAEPCDGDASIEILHAPSSTDSAWVPLCDLHMDWVSQGRSLAYVIEIHGFIPEARDGE